MSYSKEWQTRPPVWYFNEHIYPDGSKEILSGFGSVVLTNTRIGQSVPNFATKIASLVDASSDFFTQRQELSGLKPLQITMNASGHYYRVDWNITTSHPPTVNEFSLSSAENRALKKLYSSVGDVMSEVQSLPFLGEIREARRMVKDRAEQLLRTVLRDGKQLRRLSKDLRRSGKDWRFTANRLSGAFLEMQFGWLPLVGDISDAVNVVLDDHPGPYVKGAASTVRVVGDYPSTTYHSFGATSWLVETRVKQVDLVRYKYRLLIQPSVSSRLGLAWSQVPGAVWELTPWSFLVDYFLDVQGFLTSRVYGGVSTIYGTRSVRRKATADRIAIATSGSGSNGYSTCTTTTYQRIKQSSLPSYVPTLNLAGPLQGLRGFNIAALLGCRIRSY
jgi:hypothetical protein